MFLIEDRTYQLLAIMKIQDRTKTADMAVVSKLSLVTNVTQKSFTATS